VSREAGVEPNDCGRDAIILPSPTPQNTVFPTQHLVDLLVRKIETSDAWRSKSHESCDCSSLITVGLRNVIIRCNSSLITT